MLCGMVTLYYPKYSMVENILSYSAIFRKFYVVDNTPHKDQRVIEKLLNCSNVVYIDNRINLGISYSLNCIIRKSKAEGYKWTLLMDQDSIITPESIYSLYKFASEFPNNRLGIVCATYHRNYRPDVEEVTETITSGSLINTEICATCGYFDENLYIDEVDNEYCLRITTMGYKIFRLNNVKFIHQLGYKRYNNGHLTYNYPPARYYYLVRNALYVADKYQSSFPQICNEKRKHVKKWHKMVWHEDNFILKKLFMLKGYIDYKANKMGVCPWINYK